MKTTYTVEYMGDIYSLTADFAQASCPIEGDEHGRQVADFRHSPRAAMESLLREMVEMGGDEADDYADEIEAALVKMVGRDADLIEMADTLERHGDRFTGNCADDQAQEWLDADFTADQAGGWCEIGVWSASAAAEFRDADLAPTQVKDASERLIEDAGEDASDEYTDGDPIYSVCNCDTNAQVIIDAAKE
jgi:hypothetical protein